MKHERELIEDGDWTPPRERVEKKTPLKKTVDWVVDEWIKESGHLAESTRTLYQSVRRNRITPYLQDVKLSQFTKARATEWVNEIRRDHGGITKRNADAYKLIHAALQAMVDDGRLGTNPCQVKGGARTPESREKAVPTIPQLQAIVDAMPDAYKAGTQVAAWCGLRPAEWQELRRKDVERHPQPPVDGAEQQDRIILRVNRQAHRVGGEWIVDPPKGGKRRKVIVPDHLVPVIDEQLRDRAGKGAEGLLFPNAKGHQVTRQLYFKLFKDRAAEAGCPGASPHSLRHLAGTQYAVAGATVRETMKYLGHTSQDVALGYQHAAQDRAEALAAAVSTLATTTSNNTEKRHGDDTPAPEADQ